MGFTEAHRTDRLKLAIKEAQKEAANRGRSHVSTEHLLLGILNINESMASRVLSTADIDQSQIKEVIFRLITPGSKNVSADNVQFTPRMENIFIFAEEEAQNLNNNYLGTEHLLLALMREEDGMASRVLCGLGAEIEILRVITSGIQDE